MSMNESAVGPERRSGSWLRAVRLELSPALVAIMLISAGIAVVAPFDVAFTAATFNSPVLRALLAATLALAAFSHYNRTIDGDVFVFFILTVAAAETASTKMPPPERAELPDRVLLLTDRLPRFAMPPP